MYTAMSSQQRGITFGGFIMLAFLLVLVSIFGLKLIPAYIQNAQIKNVFNAIVHDPEMEKATLHDIRVSFDKRADIDDIKAIKSDEIDIAMDQGRLVLSASYPVKIRLVGNVSLYLEFNPTSAQ